MLEQQDYNQIKDIFNEEGEKLFKTEGEKLEKRIVKQVVNQVGETIEDNILPALDALEKHIDDKIAPLPDKAYLDDKLADLEGSVIVRQKKEDKKLIF